MIFRKAVIIATCLVVLASCGEDTGVSAEQAEVGIALPVGTAETTVPAPSTTTTTTETPASTTSVVSDPFRTYIATAKEHVEWLRPLVGPDGEEVSMPFGVPNPHQFGGPLTLMVVSGQPGDEWLEVQLPISPNSQTGWIRAVDYDVSETRFRAEVNLSSTKVSVFDGDELLTESDSVIGTEETPTPLGTFYVAAKRRNSADEFFLGTWAIVLSSFSEALDTFSGGEPVIAIHGTDQPDQIGQALSFGCVRVPNDVIEFLAEHLPLGAPVIVTI